MKLKVVSAYKAGLDALHNKKKYKGYLGISPGYPFFSDETVKHYCDRYIPAKKLDKYALWALEHFDKFKFFLGDYLLHYNIMAFCERQKDTAIIEADVVSDLLTQKMKEIIKGKPRLEFSRWRDIADKQDFQEILGKVREYALENSRFKQQCVELTLAGTRNKLQYLKQEKGRKDFKRALSIAKQYSIDDVALMIYLYKEWPVSISKYELPFVVKSIYNAEYPELTEVLGIQNSMGHIQLVPENETVYSTFYDNDFERLANETTKT